MKVRLEGRCGRCDRALGSDSVFKCCESCRRSMASWRSRQREKSSGFSNFVFDATPMADASVSIDKYEPEVQEQTNGVCPHLPGSDEKVEFLIGRYERGELLFQIGDVEGYVYQEDRNGWKKQSGYWKGVV